MQKNTKQLQTLEQQFWKDYSRPHAKITVNLNQNDKKQSDLKSFGLVMLWQPLKCNNKIKGVIIQHTTLAYYTLTFPF